MKMNLPVTNREREVRPNQNILSTTDLKGAINYVNPDFIDISGFSNEELLGKNHNIIRHPDMPPAAFANLWEHVKSGRSWMGIVKNRCKDGDHYWVDAFVMPIEQDGNTVEYQSVRYQADREWVARAEPIYKRLLEGKGFKPRLAARLSLTQKLVAANLGALLPAVATVLMPVSGAVSAGGLALTGLLIATANVLLMGPFRKVVRQAREIYDQPVMRRIYSGRDDEFGQIQLALKMQESQINAIVGRLSDTTRKLSEVAAVTSTTSAQTNQGVDAQQNELSMVATAMTEMVATVQEVARTTALAADAAVEGQKESGAGRVVVEQTVAAINTLAGEVQKAATVIHNLSEQSADIVRVLEVIKSIAEQTNLLALNAAIESARAGENGRGFAVVADEVRTLASRTTDSAREIETMIDRLQSGSKNAVSVMELSRKQAESSVDLATRAGGALEAISKVIDNLTDMNHQIATASEEQTAVAEEINQNIVNIKEVAETTSEGARRSVEATEDMTAAVRRLDNLVCQFRR